jgi:DNA-binding response OmpR family regulator
MEENQNAKRVMVVDDEAGALALIRIMLERNGFTVLGAKDAYAALEMLETSTPDLFVLDVMMPGMDGIELCRQIRARPQTAHTPIIILSACSARESVMEGLEAGADDYLAKPILHHNLVAKIRCLLGL